MKTYTITVNGNVYDVTVEEGTSAAAPVAAPKAAPRPAAPAPAPCVIFIILRIAIRSHTT